MIRSRITWILLLAVMTTVTGAQTPLHVGWFDFADERSQTTGLATQLAAQAQVRSHPFQLDVPSSFRPEYYDVIIFGSFSEFHPSWDAFVRREKTRIDQFIQRGGTLVQMCRYRKNDDKGRLSLLPRGFTVDRGKRDINDDEWYVSYSADPMWRPFGKDKRNGWNRLPKTKIGPNELDCGLDAFEKWSRNLKRTADMTMNMRARFPRAYALAGDHGRGRILLFQLILDKIDRTTDSLAQNQCREFFSTLITYLKSRPRIARPEPTKDPVPPKNDNVVKDEPVVERPPRSYRLRGKIFFDANRNGTLDRNESAAGGVTLRYENAVVQSNSSGSYVIEVSNERSGQITIDLPDRADVKSKWFLNLNAGAAKSATVLRDIALLPQLSSAPAARRILVATLPSKMEDSTSALMELGLSQAIADSSPELVVFLSPQQDARASQMLRTRLARVAQSNNVGFRMLAPLPDNGSSQVARLSGGDRLVQNFGTSRICLAAGRNVDRWLAQAGRGAKKESLVFIAGTPLSPDQVTGLAAQSGLLIVPQDSQDQPLPETGPRLAPIFLDSEDRDQAAAYLLLTWSENAWQVSFRPEAKEVEPALPPHPLGRGNIDELLEEAGRDK